MRQCRQNFPLHSTAANPRKEKTPPASEVSEEAESDEFFGDEVATPR